MEKISVVNPSVCHVSPYNYNRRLIRNGHRSDDIVVTAVLVIVVAFLINRYIKAVL